MDIEYLETLLAVTVFILIGFLIGILVSYEEIKVQDIKQVDNGYYITINNEIYYKEVG
jgi:hypothetical protein|nr:MAG TPA: hypothetical protein [Caudoviricetes sp.]